jgi:hypothetical protein
MAKCLQVAKRCQHYEAKLDYGFDWTREFSRKWAKDKPFDLGVTVRPDQNPVTGYQYQSSGGQSGELEPNWPRTIGGTVVDGSITWTAEAYATSSLQEQIVSDTWTVSDSPGLTVAPIAPIITAGEQLTRAVLSGGMVGTVYTVENEVLTSVGLEYVARLLLTIEGA